MFIDRMPSDNFPRKHQTSLRGEELSPIMNELTHEGDESTVILAGYITTQHIISSKYISSSTMSAVTVYSLCNPPKYIHVLYSILLADDDRRCSGARITQSPVG